MPPLIRGANAAPSMLDRRAALKLIAASLALPAAACSAPREEIVPYVRTPENLTPGIPLTFATALPLLSYAAGVLATSHEGRPTKIEGNPDHPASLGATDAFSQAAVLSLYDPDRAQTIRRGHQISTFEAVTAALGDRSPSWAADGGAGLHLLTPSTASPFFAEQIAVARRTWPNMTWRRWEPINRDQSRRGAQLAFGRLLDVRFRFDKAKIIIALDSDFLGPGPDQVRHAAGFAAMRQARNGAAAFSRLYCVEPSLTATGACADHRLATRRRDVGAVAAALAAALGAGFDAAPPPGAGPLVQAMARDLAASNGEAVIVVGEAQPPEVHALGHWMNAATGALGATLDMIDPVESDPVIQSESIRTLANDLSGGKVDTLLIMDGNPVYDAPAEIRLGSLVGAAGLSIRLGLYHDETARDCQWSVPALHPLEAWGDARSGDGAASLVQPLITPLYDGHAPVELLLAITGQRASPYDQLREFWRGKSQAKDFEAWWRQALHDGVIANLPEFEPRPFHPEAAPAAPKPPPPPAAVAPGNFELVFLPDASVWDGRFANNAWLQETPRPITRLVWTNAALVSAPDAERLGIASGDVLRISTERGSIEIPALTAPGQAEGSIAVHLGYGRSFGSIASGVGTDVYPLRTVDGMWSAIVRVDKAGGRRALPSTQSHHRMQGRDIVRTMPIAAFNALKEKPAGRPPVSLYGESLTGGPYEWAMVIDQTLCIGCNACVTACQAENNVPAVGPDEIERGREMHWLRIDSYLAKGAPSPGMLFQPVPCMHCEKAPCEPMCPVEASVHDREGLNLQVYNRCIGTRFCQSNCPYKVRRFNFFAYASGQDFANLGAPVMEAVHNPDVTVRSRGVMEKCNYCLQRISRARRAAEKENRLIRTGEVTPACAAACPTRTIVFGNLANESDPINALREQPHEYALLEELGTRPRTTYLTRVTNPAKWEAGP